MYRKLFAALAFAVLGMAASVGTASANTALNYYVGINLGDSDGSTDWTYESGGETADHDTDGAVYGVDAGVSKQWGHVYGAVEAGLSGADIGGSTDCPNPSYSCSSEIRALASVRAIVGYKQDAWLVYATAGVAAAQVKVSTEASFDGGSDQHNVTGAVYGAGVEYAITDKWSVRAEYLRYDLDEKTYAVDNELDVKADVDTDVISVGVGYHF